MPRAKKNLPKPDEGTLARIVEARDYRNVSYAALFPLDLRELDFTGAYLLEWSFAGCDLRGVSFRDAVLSGVNFEGADLRGADFTNAQLKRGCHFSAARLEGAVLTGLKGVARASGRPAILTIPSVPHINRQILDIVDKDPEALAMGSYHGCESSDPSACATTHCVAGWAVTLAGAAGKRLETRVGPNAAGALIFNASGSEVPEFYGLAHDAIDALRRRAKKETA